MDAIKKKYKYRVERIKGGKWVPMLQTDCEDKDTFGHIANSVEYQYRILRDGEDVTQEYKNSYKEMLACRK